VSGIPPLVDEFIALHERKWPEFWREWRTFVNVTRRGSYPRDFSDEEVARRSLADCWPGPSGFSSPLHLDHHTWIYEALVRVIDLLLSGECRLIRGDSGEPIPLNGITPEWFRFDTGEIVPGDGTRTHARLVLRTDTAPTAAPQVTKGPAPLKLAKREEISAAIEAVNDAADEAGEPIPNKSKLPPKVRKWLKDRGLRAKDTAQIRNIANDPQHAARRLPGGPTLTNKRRQG